MSTLMAGGRYDVGKGVSLLFDQIGLLTLNSLASNALEHLPLQNAAALINTSYTLLYTRLPSS